MSELSELIEKIYASPYVITEVVPITLEEFLMYHGVLDPVDDFMMDKMKLPHGETKRDKQLRLQQSELSGESYHLKRQSVIKEYQQLLADGKIRDKTELEKCFEVASGFPELASVQAARRMLFKRGYDYRTCKPIKDDRTRQSLSLLLDMEVYQPKKKRCR